MSNPSDPMNYTQSKIRPILEAVLEKAVAQKPITVGSLEPPQLFDGLDVYGRKPTGPGIQNLMADGDNDGYADAYKKACSANEVSALLGRLTWRDYASERLMWAFSVKELPRLRERLISLCACLICWLVEIDIREQSHRSGES